MACTYEIETTEAPIGGLSFLAYRRVSTTITSMAAVGIVFGFLAGVVADTVAVSLPIAGIAFLLTGAVFVFSRLAPLPQIITITGKTRIMKGFR